MARFPRERVDRRRLTVDNMTDLTAIIGIAVVFDRPCDRVNLCCAKNRFGKIGPEGILFCSNCGTNRGHLPQSTTTQIIDIIASFGALDTPIILRAGGRQ
jgi:hypothetical protein